MNAADIETHEGTIRIENHSPVVVFKFNDQDIVKVTTEQAKGIKDALAYVFKK